MPQCRFSVVVIGAGPAGLATAAALGMRGVSTLICESSRSPVEKACGEGLTPSGLADLERLGVPLAALSAQGRPFSGLRWITETGTVAQASFAEGPGIGLRRVALSETLLARVRSLPHVTVMQGVRARLRRDRVPGGRSRFAVQVEGSLLEPQLIIGADGTSSRIRRHAHIVSEAGSPPRWSVRRHFAIAPWTDHVEVYWSSGAEAYVTPVGVELTNIALLFDRKELWGRSGGELFRRLLSRFPALEQRLGGARALGLARAAGPLQRWPARPFRRGLLLVGDAAGHVDAFTGESVGVALRQALVLADVLGPALARASPEPVPTPALEKFVRAARRASRGARRLTTLLFWLERHPRLLEHAIARLADDAGLFRHFLSANQGMAPILGLPGGSPAALRRLRLASRHPF